MKYNKFVAPVMAGVLAMSISMVGCGGSKTNEPAADQTAQETTETPEVPTEPETPEVSAETEVPAESEANTADDAEEIVLYWKGELDSGDVFIWEDGEDENSDSSVIMYDTHANDDILAFHGKGTLTEDGVATITDSDTGATFSFTLTGADEEGNLTIDAGEHGTGTLKAIGKDEFLAEVENIQKSVEDFLNNLIDEVSNMTEEDLEEAINSLKEIRDQA